MQSTVTLEEFLAMNPGQRLKFGQHLGDRITPEVVTYLIHTYLTTEMHPRTREIYLQALNPLIAQVNPIALLVLAYRHINTSKASPALLPSHRKLHSILTRLQGTLELTYIRTEFERGVPQYFCGTLSRRILPSNLAQLGQSGLQTDDGVLFDPNAVKWRDRRSRGTVEMIHVPINDQLPDTLGLET